MKTQVKRVLVATDFSDAATAALAWAVDIVEANHASLHVLHVLETVAGAEPVALDVDVRGALERGVEDKAWEELRGLLPSEDRTRLQVELAIEWGIPADEILRYVREHRIDLVSLGSRTAGDPPEPPLLGHVAETVVREAPCSVLTIRHAAA
jgi:nucleotide-binding universal stress UspA family protein